MTREEKQKVIDALKISAPVMAVTPEEFNDYIKAINQVMDWLEQEPKTIQEKQVESEKYEKAFDDGYKNGYVQARFDYEQEPYDFARWVAREIFDKNWEYNKDAFAEIACRKLAKLGIVRAKGDEWELVNPKESEEQE